MSSTKALFIELLQVSVEARDSLSRIPTEDEWYELKDLCMKHALSGVGFYAIQRLANAKNQMTLPRHLIMEMFNIHKMQKERNEHLLADILNLTRIFESEGFGSCILKGQGLAVLYPEGMERTPGDIDVWIAKKDSFSSLCTRRKEIVKLCRKVVGIREVFYHHTDLPLKGKDIEVHFTPSWMFAPWHNAKLQHFFEKEWERRRFIRIDAKMLSGRKQMFDGFYVPSLEMNVIYVLLHIYRHVFSEGIGLRQVLDYFYVLHQRNYDKQKVLDVINSIGLLPFAGAMMWVLKEVLAMREDIMICKPDRKRGQLLLDEIMMSGNFGKWDERLSKMNRDSLWSRFNENMKRNLRLVHHYPSEALCAPIWRIWQKIWKSYNGF